MYTSFEILHEQLLVFGSAKYTPQTMPGHKPLTAGKRGSRTSLYGAQRDTNVVQGRLDRWQTSVLPFDVVNNIGKARRHPTQKPVSLLRWLVRAYSNPGDLVADPTCGSGALVHAARDEGRPAIGWELHEPTATAAAAWLTSVDPLFTARAA
jgi:hypothetical protein